MSQADSSSTNKLNSAQFAEEREQAMLRSRKAGNPNTRMVPELSKSAKAARANVEPLPSETAFEATEESGSPSSDPASSDDDIDYPATSVAIMDALRQVKGHLELSKTERDEACAILGGKHAMRNVSHPVLLSVICVIIGLVLGYVIAGRK